MATSWWGAAEPSAVDGRASRSAGVVPAAVSADAGSVGGCIAGVRSRRDLGEHSGWSRS